MFENGCSLFAIYLLSFIGLYASLIFLYETLNSPVRIIWRVLFPKPSLKDRYGPWAVVTGSSDGIGKQYALNLARNGMNLLLISRTKSKLQQVEREIRSECNVEVKIMDIDFSDGYRVYARIRKELEGLDVGVLVNNVGVIHKHPITVEEITQSEMDQVFTVNMLSTVMMVQMVLPGMKLRHRGIIVNMSSEGGHVPMPFVALYGASKAFLCSYSEALQEELRDSGVECQLVMPMVVADTSFLVYVGQRFLVKLLSANLENFGKMAVWLIGKTYYTTGCWYHAVQVTGLRMFPRWILTKIILFYMRRMSREQEKAS
ncbi:very-long-chain 3-oxoacyl-CoA reductase-like [Armigeres subalbatus]|uniref:very-long-chain 3-oxoacyl-CoA reductase-like n=1 Tax=Armigeres subalbatus TaxID=124917 RepID=UPI002ED24CB2